MEIKGIRRSFLEFGWFQSRPVTDLVKLLRAHKFKTVGWKQKAKFKGRKLG